MSKIKVISNQIKSFLSKKNNITSKKRKAVGGINKEIYSKIISHVTKDRFSEPGISEYAYVVDTAIISKSATVSPGSYIGANVKIGDNTRIYPNVTILDDTIVGKNVIIGSGSVIGGEGFGYFLEKKSQQIKQVPQLGYVVIEDDVHIGSNVSVDRSSVGETVVGKGTKINNNVHIAHNVQIGNDCLIMAGVSISGSTTIGDRVVVNPQAAVSKHVKIGDNSEVGMNSTVIRDVRPNTRVIGSPAKEK